MWPVGHGAVGYILYTLSTRWRGEEPPGAGAAALAGLGGLVPDLIDKPLAWYVRLLPTGRSLAHSVVVVVPLVTIVYLLARSRGHAEEGLALDVGILSHPVADALPALWGSASADFLLWPLVAVEVPESYPTLLGLLRSSLTDPYFLVELVLLVVALSFWRLDGYPGRQLLRHDRPD